MSAPPAGLKATKMEDHSTSFSFLFIFFSLLHAFFLTQIFLFQLYSLLQILTRTPSIFSLFIPFLPVTLEKESSWK